MNTSSRTVLCVDGVCVCKRFRRRVPCNTVYSVSVSVVEAVHDSLFEVYRGV